SVAAAGRAAEHQRGAETLAAVAGGVQAERRALESQAAGDARCRRAVVVRDVFAVLDRAAREEQQLVLFVAHLGLEARSGELGVLAEVAGLEQTGLQQERLP